jgi:hypothetical protein
MSSDGFPFLLLFDVLSLLRSYMSISHSHELSIVPNYAFS